MSEGAAINVFNLDRKKLIRNAPVKNQCSGDYFYGTDDRLEQAIQLLESGYGQALKSFLKDGSTLTDENKTMFNTFWIFQHLRTESAAKRAVEMTESMRGVADLPPGEFTLGIKEAVQIACRAFVDSMHELDDLKFCIFKNKTDVPFITSDNPAVLTNKWRLDKERMPGRSFGMGSAGMLAILPLTPNILFLGYDGGVYSVPKKNGIVEIRCSRDVIAFNRHQFLQCAANVYVHDALYEEELIMHYTEIESARPKERNVVHYAQLDHTEGDYTRYAVVQPENRDKTKEAIMHSQVIHPHPEVWPSQIRIRSNGSVYSNGTGIGYVRLSRTLQTSTRPFWKERT